MPGCSNTFCWEDCNFSYPIVFGFCQKSIEHVCTGLFLDSILFHWSLCSKVKVKVTQSCLTLCDPMDNTVPAILQARILEWVAFPVSRGSSQPRDRTQVSHIAGRFFTSWATREAQEYWSGQPIPSPANLPDLGIEPGSPALQADSLPTELSGKPWSMCLSLTSATLSYSMSSASQVAQW